MKMYFRHILMVTVSALILLTSCQKDQAEAIPREELSRIYAEMLLTDQWILETPNVRLIADTSLVYAPILEKYGYDAADYRKSVYHYMDDPERFAKILRETATILDARLADLEVRKEELKRLEAIRKEVEKFRPDVKWDEVYMKNDDIKFDSSWKSSLIHEEKKESKGSKGSRKDRIKESKLSDKDILIPPPAASKGRTLSRRDLKTINDELK